jgi:hypothetical protein
LPYISFLTNSAVLIDNLRFKKVGSLSKRTSFSTCEEFGQNSIKIKHLQK